MSDKQWLCLLGFHRWTRWSTVKEEECALTVFGQVPSLDRSFSRVTLATQEKSCERCGIASWREVTQ